MGRIAAIDFGTVRLGIAITDESKIIATPLPTLRAKKTLAETAHLIAQTLASYPSCELVIIGLPLLMSGKESPMSTQVRAFATLLEKELSIPILLWDERLTSAGIEKMLKQHEISRKERAQLSDSLSAISILQNYLDSLRFKQNNS